MLICQFSVSKGVLLTWFCPIFIRFWLRFELITVDSAISSERQRNGYFVTVTPKIWDIQEDPGNDIAENRWQSDCGFQIRLHSCLLSSVLFL